MSLTIIESEIRRFLENPDAEVLCIKGSWGVGKTYAWRQFLRDCQESGSFALNKYSYVSLFGLNSLEELRFAIFESTVSGHSIATGPDTNTFSALIAKGSDSARRLKPLFDAASAFFNRKQVADVLYRSAFLSVRNQLVCLDDLERAGSGLDMRDVLGLASFLKEDRKCKVVLLLNDERMEESDRKEFERQLEKVVDTNILFRLTAEEAVEIAFSDGEECNSILRERIIQLGITNIRVIKKIQRQATKLLSELGDLKTNTIDQALTTLVLGQWAVMQPDLAPSIEFIKSYNRIAETMRAGREEMAPPKEIWRATLEEYPYAETDRFDELILNSASAGYFDGDALRQAAEETEKNTQKAHRDSAFSKAWDDLYHGSLSAEDDEFLDELFRSSIEEARGISVLNINSAIHMLRECGRDQQADQVIAAYVSAHDDQPLEFFNLENNHFLRSEETDIGLREAFEQRRKSYVDPREPLEALMGIARARDWSDADLALLSKLSADDFETLFESLQGNDLKSAIEIVQRIGRAGFAESAKINEAVKAALETIASKSPLRARKLGRYGVTPPKSA